MSMPETAAKPGKEWRLVERYSYVIGKISVDKGELADIKTGERTVEEHISNKLAECLASLLGVRLDISRPEDDSIHFISESGFSKDFFGQYFEVKILQRKMDWRQVKVKPKGSALPINNSSMGERR